MYNTTLLIRALVVYWYVANSTFRNLKTPEQWLLLTLIRADGNDRWMELDILVLSWCYSLCRKHKSFWSKWQRMNTITLIWNFLLYHTFFHCLAYFLQTWTNPGLSWFQRIVDMYKNLVFIKKIKTTALLFLCEGLKLSSLEVNWLLVLKNKSSWDPSLQQKLWNDVNPPSPSTQK